MVKLRHPQGSQPGQSEETGRDEVKNELRFTMVCCDDEVW